MIEEGRTLDEALEVELAELTEGNAFKAVEFGADGITVWEVRRDGNGTPQARQQPPLPAPSTADPRTLYEQRLSPLIGHESRLVIVRSADERAEVVFDVVFDRLHRSRPDAPVFLSTTPLAGHLRDVIRNSPLTRWYELVVLRQTRSGQLRMDGHALFPPGAQRGYSHQFTVRCEPSDSRGTVFAVVTREARCFRIVSLKSAVIPPGVYEPNAVLLRPGQVVFEGLPAVLRTEQRRWPEIVGAIPARLDRAPAVHLVCVIEVSCSEEKLANRIDRIEQLIASVDAGRGELSVSLVSYGPHAFDHWEHEEPAAVLAWATTSDRALTALRGLRGRRPPVDEYPWAAQLECALAEVATRLTDHDGRPVLVTVGSRPPHPPRVDLSTEIIPCPERKDWRWSLQHLRTLRDITFGALHDEGTAGTIWNQLGRDAHQPLNVVEVPRFAAETGLYGPLQYVPFPLTD